jgi:3-oxoacyl-[acyl-carrier protein] reductase
MLLARFGRIVFISSAVAERGGFQGQAAYAGSKAALNALARILTAEIARRGDLTVNTVAPGPVRTAMTATAFDDAEESVLAITPAGRFGTPAEVADVVAFLASGDASHVTGRVVTSTGFRQRHFRHRRKAYKDTHQRVLNVLADISP